MSTSLSLITNALTMTSREIAELTGKEHKNVLRDIDNLLISLGSELSLGFSMTYEGPKELGYRYFLLDRDSAYCLMSGYDAISRMRIIKRWQELEAAQKVQISLEETASRAFRAWADVAALLEIPQHIAQQEAVKAVRSNHGVDFSPLLLQAPAQSNIPEEAVMLEPADLARRLGIRNAFELNKWLHRCGLQEKLGKSWEPTMLGKPHCTKHAWATRYKSGYNLKWSLKFITSFLPPNWDAE